MRYPLRDQSREEMRAMVAGVYRGYVKAELKVQVEGLNSLYNMCTWLEAPHFETLEKSEVLQFARAAPNDMTSMVPLGATMP